VATIAGMAAAAEWICGEPPDQTGQEKLRDHLWGRVAESFSGAQQNGNGAPRLANTLNVSFSGIDSETMLMALDLEGVCASSGSACMVGSVVASHVLLAMGLPMERATSAIRFSLGKNTSKAELDLAADAIDRIIDRFTKSKLKRKAYAVAETA
jgi:cysteine desulfurase